LSKPVLKENVLEMLESKNQALVLVNYGNATGQEILNISMNIQQTILNIFGIQIEAEVNVI
jgi:UDP-N-acetylmuramate dehydrogenase